MISSNKLLLFTMKNCMLLCTSSLFDSTLYKVISRMIDYNGDSQTNWHAGIVICRINVHGPSWNFIIIHTGLYYTLLYFNFPFSRVIGMFFIFIISEGAYRSCSWNKPKCELQKSLTKYIWWSPPEVKFKVSGLLSRTSLDTGY